MLASSPTLLQAKDKYIDKMNVLEVTQLREKVATLEDEKKKLLLRMETLKKEHNEEITQVYGCSSILSHSKECYFILHLHLRLLKSVSKHTLR